MMAAHLFLFAICVASVACQHRIAPSQTVYAEDGFDFWGWTPRPTSGPFDLFKRQTAPSELCGYISGDYYDSLTCGPGFYCAENAEYSAIGCCSSYYLESDSYTLTGCFYHTLCYGSAYAASVCTAGNTICSDSLLLQCTDGPDTYCFEYSFTDNGYGSVGCTSDTSVLTIVAGFDYTNGPTTTSAISTTSSSEYVTTTTSSSEYITTTTSSSEYITTTTSSSEYIATTTSSSEYITTTPVETTESTTSSTTTTPVYITPTTSSTTTAVIYTTSSTSPSYSSSFTSTTEIIPQTPSSSYSPVPPPTGPSTTTTVPGAPASKTSTGSGPAQTSHSPSHVGVIAGSVVGGVFGLALLALLGFCLIRRKKRNSGPTQEVSHSYQPTPQPYSPEPQYARTPTPMSQNQPPYSPVSQVGPGYQYQHPEPGVAELPYQDSYQGGYQGGYHGGYQGYR